MPLGTEDDLVHVHREEPHEPIVAISVDAKDHLPSRELSRLRRMQDAANGDAQPQEPNRRPSLLQRMGVAPLDLVSAGRNAYDASDVPLRSPTDGHVRQGSGLVRRKVSAEVVRAAVTADGGNWHKLTKDDLLTHFKIPSLEMGLTKGEAERRLQEFGLNKITEVGRESLIIKFFRNVFTGFSAFLLFACISAFIIFAIEKSQQAFFDVQTLALAISLIVVVIVTAAFTTYQEGQADNIMDQLAEMSSEFCYAVRDGVTTRLPSELLVPGDVLKIGVGEKVPADLRVVEAMELKVNNAPLTGENIDVKLHSDARHELLFEARNVARCGCTFVSGHGIAVVYATGDSTFLGSIAQATTQAETPDTLLRREVRRIILFMGSISVVLSALVLGLSFGTGDDWATAVVYVIGIVIANVPEGLLPQITLSLTLTAKRMLDRGVVVSNLEIIETLGAVTVICSDKTGTITCNRMTVSHLYYNGSLHHTEWTPGVQNADHADSVMFRVDDEGLVRLRMCTALNTDAIFTSFDKNILKRDTRGDASEAALIKFFEPQMGDGSTIELCRAANRRIAGMPFTSANKFMISVSEMKEPSLAAEAPHRIYIKGAAERVLPRCKAYYGDDGSLRPMTEADVERLNAMVLRLASLGERVLAFGEMPYYMPDGLRAANNDLTDEATGEPLYPTNGFHFIGLISLVDPPRHTVRAALDTCHSAGIQVYMVTGDHPATAVAICKSLGYDLPTCSVLRRTPDQDPSRTFCVVHGLEDIPKFTEADWDFVFSCKQAVFARTMPEQKQLIVHHLNKLGAIVAMTGDGVNDASALKVAHVGIAMGSGSAVAREAAQVVLLDDDFGSIVVGIREGRLIFENLKKCVAYVLTHLVPEVIPFLVTIISGLPLGMQTLVVLFIDLGTEMAPGISLAYEEPEDNIMLNPPRSPDEHLVSVRMMILTYISVGLIETFACYWAFFWVFYFYGFKTGQLWGRSSDWASSASDLDAPTLQLYTDMCNANSHYVLPCSDQDSFFNYRQDALAKAQAVYFLTLVWCQYGNLMARRTQVNSGLSLERLRSNPYMLLACFGSLCLAILTVYLPGLNGIVQFAPHPEMRFLFTAVWVIPIFVGLEELKKYLIRRKLPERSWLYQMFVF